MTLAEFHDLATEGIVVECVTVQQRRNVLELFEESRFRISAASRKHLDVEADEDDDTAYMHPGYKPQKGWVSCYRDFGRAKADFAHGIKYDDIKDAIENPKPLDDRSDAEFVDDFASLMS